MLDKDETGEIKRRVEQARVKLLYENLKYGEWNTWLSGTAVSAVLWQDHQHSVVAAWWLYIFICGVLLVVTRRLFRTNLKDEGKVRHAGNAMSLVLLLNGIGYGLTMWLFWSQTDVLNNILLTAIGVVVFMSYAYPLMPFPLAYILPAAAVSAGIFTRLISTYEILYMSLAAGYLSISYLFLHGVINSYRTLSDSIMLRYQLEHANKEVMRESNEKNAFFANMSHEIRTPMNGVIGVTQVLADTPLTEEQKKYVGIIENSGRSLLSLINEILDLTKIESGHLYFRETPFKVRILANEIAEMFSVMASQKGLGFVCKLDDKIPECLVGDEKRLRQILVNLLGNALKFCDKGEIKLSINVELLGKNSCEIRIEVEDSGNGIPEDKLSRIFDRFQRIDESRIGGTGLGLAICKLLVEGMNGDIHVESWFGVGSRFTVLLELPIGDCKGGVEEKPLPENVRGLTILVVDDDEINQLVITSFLSALNHNSLSVNTGKEAINRLKHESFDLILTDIHMPDVGGVEVTRWIRNASNEHLRAVPIVGMTASIMSEEKDKYLSAGMNIVLGKPIQRDELDDAIRQVVTTTKLGTETEVS